jgi:tetratricopeptide (TPR) repeat protein
MSTLIAHVSCRLLPAILAVQLAAGCGPPRSPQVADQGARSSNEALGASFAALADELVAKKNWPEALRAANAAIEAGSSDARVYIAKGRAHDALDEADDAESAWLKAFAQTRKSADALLLLAESVERRGRRERCEQLYRRIIDEVDPRCVPARERLFLLYLNSDHLDKARECYAGFADLGLSGPAAERCRAALNLATSQLPEGSQRLAVYQDELRKAAADYPHDAVIPLVLAMSYFTVGDLDRALVAVDQALRIDPENMGARELKVRSERGLLRFSEASALVEGLLQDRPRDVGYLQQLLELATIQADYDTAATVLRKLLKRDDLGEQRKLVTVELIETLLSARRSDEAVDLARAWLAEASDQPGRREIWLITLTRAGRNDEAIEAVTRWLAEDPTNTALRNRYVVQLQAAGRSTEAQQQVLSWLADAPDDVDLNRLLISLLWSSRQWDSAIEVAQTGAELPEHRDEYETLVGQSYLLARRYDEAIDFYRDRANLLATESAFGELLFVLIRAERFTEAEQLAGKLLVVATELIRRNKSRPVDPSSLVSVRRQLVSIYQLTDRQDQALQQLQAIYELAPGDPGACNDLGYSWADAGERIEDAERLIRFAVAKKPEEASFLDSLGWVLYKQGNFKEAVYYLRLAIRKSADEDPVVRDHLGDALYRGGSPDEARTYWQQSFGMTGPDHDPPPDAEYRRLHERIKAKLGQVADGRDVATAPLAPPAQAAASTQSAEDKPQRKEGQPADREGASQLPTP